MTIETLHAAIDDLKNRPVINIKGKSYTTVATRVEVFRYHYGDEYSIVTEPFGMDNEWVRVKATILNGAGAVIATGIAEENRSQGPINRTSALENCETSAIGRCLANFGLHGGEYATADEVDTAIKQQETGNKDFHKTNLKARSHEIVREIHACTDMDQLTAYWPTIKDALKNMKSHYPEGLEACEAAKEKMKEELTDVAERHALQAEGTPLDAG